MFVFIKNGDNYFKNVKLNIKFIKKIIGVTNSLLKGVIIIYL